MDLGNSALLIFHYAPRIINFDEQFDVKMRILHVFNCVCLAKSDSVAILLKYVCYIAAISYLINTHISRTYIIYSVTPVSNPTQVNITRPQNILLDETQNNLRQNWIKILKEWISLWRWAVRLYAGGASMFTFDVSKWLLMFMSIIVC